VERGQSFGLAKARHITVAIQVFIQQFLNQLIQINLRINSPKEVEFEVADCNFKQLDRAIIVIGRLRTALKPAPLMPLLSVQTEVELPKVRSTAPSSDEKTIVVGPVEPEKKKTRKLKKPSVSIPNESLQIGIDEGSVGQA
jgi:hypothetical protein